VYKVEDKENKRVKNIIKRDKKGNIVKKEENIVRAGVILALYLIKKKENIVIRTEAEVLKKSTKNKRKANKKRNTEINKIKMIEILY
jgi:hypothetical protein